VLEGFYSEICDLLVDQALESCDAARGALVKLMPLLESLAKHLGAALS